MVQIGDVEDPETLEIGMPVRLEFRRISWDGEAGVIFYGHKAVRAGSDRTGRCRARDAPRRR